MGMTDAGHALRMDAAADDAILAGARQQLSDEGWCVVPDVLTQDEAAAALDRLWAAARAGEAVGERTYMPELDPNASNVRVFYLLERDALFRDLIRHPLALRFVRQLLGDDFLISNFTANIARPGSRSMALHSDQSLVVPGPWIEPWSLNVIWCLTDTRFENGATLFIPGSHHWQSRADVPADADRMLRPFEARAGSIVVMDGRIWHTSGANITADEDRALMFAYYSAGFLRPQVNWNAALSPQVQEGLSSDMRRWLGLEIAANLGTGADLRPLAQQFAREEQAA